MTEHKKILEMIETVKPDDIHGLCLIDMHVFCYLEKSFLTELSGEHPYYEFKMDGDVCWHIYDETCGTDECRSFASSRDALKAIRPDGWGTYSAYSWNDYAVFQLDKGAFETVSTELQTEELAELHAIIQAIAWERENK